MALGDLLKALPVKLCGSAASYTSDPTSMKIERKSHQQLQQLAMRLLRLGNQLIGIQISRYGAAASPPGVVNAAGFYPTVSRNSRNYETNDVLAAKEQVAFLASVPQHHNTCKSRDTIEQISKHPLGIR